MKIQAYKPGQVITSNFSGDSDFTIQNQTNTIIQNQRSLYEEYFTLKSGDITEIVNNAIKNIKIENADISGEIMIIDYLKGNPGDFIISWHAFTPNFTIKGNSVEVDSPMIPANQINFSQIERENPTMHNVMTWVRAITTLSILSLLIHQAWLVTMACLGVGLEVYQGKQEEINNLKKQEQANNRKIMHQLEISNAYKLREYEHMARKRGWKK